MVVQNTSIGHLKKIFKYKTLKSHRVYSTAVGQTNSKGHTVHERNDFFMTEHFSLVIT
jgi:hypothetical protein